jgi:hypothetical protein
MSHNSFGLGEYIAALKTDLRNLPHELRQEANGIVQEAAQSAATDITTNYVRGKTGNLAKGVKVKTVEIGQFSTGAIVASTAKHAFIYENGTQVRHTAAGAYRGRMPPAPPGRAFIPVITRKRKQMYLKLADLVRRMGLQVTGTP